MKFPEEDLLTIQDPFPISVKNLTKAEIDLFAIINRKISDGINLLPNGSNKSANKLQRRLFYFQFANPITKLIGDVYDKATQDFSGAANEDASQMYKEIQKICFSNINLEDLLMRTSKHYVSNTRHTFNMRQAIVEYINVMGVSPAAKSYVSRFMDAHMDKCEQNMDIWQKFDEIDLFKQWCKGEFTYKQSLFPSEGAIKEFSAGFLRRRLATMLEQMVIKEAGQIATEATAQFQRRILEHEQQLWAQREEHYAELRRKQEKTDLLRQEAIAEIAVQAAERRRREAQEAWQRAIDEQKRYLEFMASPQIYPVDGQAGKIWDQLEHFAGSNARGTGAAANARVLMHMLEEVSGMLDMRGQGIKELGNVLLSAPNLLAAARAFEADNPFKGTAAINGSGGKLQLVRLYNASATVRSVVDRLLQSDDGIVLLATLTRGQERSRNYAQFLLGAHRQLSGIETKITAFEAQLAPFSPDEQAELRNDAEYKALLEQRAARRKELDLDNVRDGLANEIRQAFQGIHNRKIVSVRVPVVEIAKKAGIELPDTWLKKLNGEFYPAASPEGDKHVHICSNEFPYIQFDIKRNAAESTLLSGLQKLRGECEQHRVNLEMVQQLSETGGFQIAFANDKALLQHKEYGIAVTLEGAEAEQTVNLLKAKAQFEERQFQQQAMLETVKHAGIGLEGVDEELRANGAITLKHTAFGSVTIAPRGYLSADDFTTIQYLLNQVQQGQKLPDVVPLDTEAAAETPSATWQPKPGQTMMIFDASTLSKLAAQRSENGHTWLDIIKCTARLPNVKVVIPAVVADFELQGKIPVYDDKGHRTGFEQADPRFQNPEYAFSYSAKGVAKFLQTASRAKIESDGTVRFEPGINQNVIIMETESDKALYHHISDIIHSGGDDRISRLQNEIYKKDEGDLAINRIVKELPFKMPIMIVSDDSKYFASSAPLTSGQGMPVGQAGTGCYLDAEIRAREPILRGMLKESDPLSLYRIGEAINQYWQRLRPDTYYYFNRHSKRGQYAEPNGHESDHIYSLVRKGFNTVKKHGNGGKWATGDLKNAVIPHPIDPAAVHNRPTGGWALGSGVNG